MASASALIKAHPMEFTKWRSRQDLRKYDVDKMFPKKRSFVHAFKNSGPGYPICIKTETDMMLSGHVSHWCLWNAKVIRVVGIYQGDGSVHALGRKEQARVNMHREQAHEGSNQSGRAVPDEAGA